jgi:hypothetical protein
LRACFVAQRLPKRASGHAPDYIAGGVHMFAATKVTADLNPVGAPRPVEVDATTMHIRDLRVDRAGVVEYLQGIPPEKQEIALVHLLEVGVIELAARRRRFSASR